MTTVCATKIKLPIADDILYVVTFGNEAALAKNVRLIGEIESADNTLSTEEQQRITDAFVVAADRFRSEIMRLLEPRK